MDILEFPTEQYPFIVSWFPQFLHNEVDNNVNKL